ncbi:MAG: hypothetical protein H0X62_15550, partial [Bacteroidetes bacterium]|nr:hypothetical protein [Bacteroidota bacterium]
MKAVDKAALGSWDDHLKSFLKALPVDRTESQEDKRKRIAYLKANPEEWKRYYFPNYFKYPSAKFHLKASKRLLNNFKTFKHWYEVRHWARGLSKSTTTMMDVLFLCFTGELKNIILTSSTYDAAENFLNKYKVQAEANARLINDYGVQELPGHWTARCFKTRMGIQFLALGAGQSPRGTSNEEIRPDCIIIDDFDTDEECRNEDIIDKKWEWFEKALMFTVDVSAAYLIIWLGNIIAEDCCVVRAGKMADHCEIINIRDEKGISIWPEKNPEEDIDYLLGKVSYEAGQQEYFNNPMRAGKAFQEMTYAKCPPINQCPFIVIYADPATSNKDKPVGKKGKMNSAKSVVVIGFQGFQRFVYKAYLDNVNNANFIDWLYAANDYAEKAKAKFTYIENNSLQDPFYEQVLAPLIYQKGTERGAMIGVIPDTRKKPDKYVRVEATLEPLNRNGNLILNIEEKENPHMKRLEAQFKA